MRLKVGHIVELKVPCLGNKKGTIGIVYEEYGTNHCTVIFPNGLYDGFSPDDQDKCLRKLGKTSLKYVFIHVVRLSEGLFVVKRLSDNKVRKSINYTPANFDQFFEK